MHLEYVSNEMEMVV